MTAGSAVAAGHAAPPAPLWLALRRIPGAVRPRSTPAKLFIVLAGLLVASLLWGGVAAWTVAEHASAAGNVVTVSEPLSVDAQQIYRSLSAADATEAAAFLAGGPEPLSLRAQYLADITRAARQVDAAAAAAGQSAAAASLATLSTGLPHYAGLVETARANNRLGLPLGAAYLREASEYMRATLLPAAENLSAQENAQLAAADQGATDVPYAAIIVALIATLSMLASQLWLARRTNRILNPGLLVASVAGLASLVWLVTALTVARTNLDAARDHGSAPVEALARAETAALRAHADESLTLIDRDNFAPDPFQADFVSQQKRLGPGPGTLLTDAAATARGSRGGPQAAAALGDAPTWYIAHQQVRSLNDSGQYTAAVDWALGNSPAGSGYLFGVLDTDLTRAIAADQASFRSAAQQGRDDLAFLEAGMIAASLVMVAGCAWGISRRLAEYR